MTEQELKEYYNGHTKKETWLFALSVAYIFTIIFTGIL